MWECIVNAWAWLGSNSGQIQIIIALGAIWLAFQGYKKVLEQIRISQKQEQIANDQRGSELKIHALNVALMALERNTAKINNLKEILDLSKIALKSVNSDSEYSADEIAHLIETIKSKIEDAEEVHEDVLKLCNVLNEQNIIYNQDALKYTYEALILIINDQLNTSLLKHHFVKTEN